MQIKLAYGRYALDVTLATDANATIIESAYVAGLADPENVLCEKLCNPIGSRALRDLVSRNDSIAIIFSDITRPTPNHLIVCK